MCTSGAASPRQFSPTRLKGLGATILAVARSGALRSKSAVRGAAKALETGRNAHRNAAAEAGSFITAPTRIAGRRLRPGDELGDRLGTLRAVIVSECGEGVV